MKALSVRGLTVGYGARPVLRGVDLDVAAGELVGLVGPNGAGKSTLLRCLAALQRAGAGRVELDGVELLAMRPREVARHLAVVPQTCSPAFPVPVAHFVGLGRYAHERFFGGPTPHDREVVDRCLRELLLQPFADRSIDALSGGEFRRVLLAQALAQEPEVLLLDEPVQQLDLLHQLEVMEFARRFVRSEGRAGIVVLHELDLAARFCDRLALLHDGRVLATGAPEQVLTAANLRLAYGVEVALGRCAATGTMTVVPTAAARGARE